MLLKGVLLGLRQFLSIENALKMTRNAFCFTLKALFVLKLFRFLSWRFGHIKKRLDWKGQVNFEIYDITSEANNSNTHTTQCLKK